MPLDLSLVNFDIEKKEEVKSFSTIKDAVKKSFSRLDTINRNGRISPSSGCSYCPRQAFLRGIETYDDYWDASSEMYARIGVTLEDMIGEGLHKQNFLLGQGIRLWENEELRLGAEFDLAINDNSRFKIVECKTCSDLPANINSKPYQYWQLLLYQAYYCCDGMLLYVSRKVMGKQGNEMDLLIRDFESPFDIELSQNAIFRSAQSRWLIDNKIIPSKPIHITSKGHCGFCSFIDKCWNMTYENEKIYQELDAYSLSDCIDYAEEYTKTFFSKENLAVRRLDLYRKLTDDSARYKSEISYDDFKQMFSYFGV